MDILFYTFSHRWYVTLFLLTYLFIAIRSHGWRFTFQFLIVGYFIAWISEGLSIRTGFPYGWYFYIYENLQGEWLNWGVPVWDSMSYVFLCFAGYSVAEFVARRSLLVARNTGTPNDERRATSLRTHELRLPLLAALFTTILDIIVDPLSNMGEQWFLGKIYHYPHPGFYFGIPFFNFAGWFLTAFLIVGINILLCRGAACCARNLPYDGRSKQRPYGVYLYFGIFAFNWLITLFLRQWFLALADLAWIALPLFWVLHRKKTEKSEKLP